MNTRASFSGSTILLHLGLEVGVETSLEAFRVE
jgi:hypothetical protein